MLYVLDWCVVCTVLMCCMYWTGVLYVLDCCVVCTGLVRCMYWTGVLYVLDWCIGLVWDHTCPIYTSPVNTSYQSSLIHQSSFISQSSIRYTVCTVLYFVWGNRGGGGGGGFAPAPLLTDYRRDTHICVKNVFTVTNEFFTPLKIIPI